MAKRHYACEHVCGECMLVATFCRLKLDHANLGTRHASSVGRVWAHRQQCQRPSRQKALPGACIRHLRPHRGYQAALPIRPAKGPQVCAAPARASGAGHGETQPNMQDIHCISHARPFV